MIQLIPHCAGNAPKFLKGMPNIVSGGPQLLQIVQTIHEKVVVRELFNKYGFECCRKYGFVNNREENEETTLTEKRLTSYLYTIANMNGSW